MCVLTPAHFLSAGSLWSRLGTSSVDVSGGRHKTRSSSRSSDTLSSSSSSARRRRGDGEPEEQQQQEKEAVVEEEDDSTLQKVWGAMIKQKQERLSHKMKKSRLDNLPSLQIEISRDSSDDSDA